MKPLVKAPVPARPILTLGGIKARHDAATTPAPVKPEAPPPPTPSRSPPTGPIGVRVLSYVPINFGVLRGRCDVEPPALGLVLEGVRVLQNANSAEWCALPRTVKVSPENEVLFDEHGNRRFEPLGRWVNRPRELQFSREVLADLRERFPDALQPPPPPSPSGPESGEGDGQ